MLKRFALSVFSGLLLGLSWVGITDFFPLVFIALVPFLCLENQILEQKLSSAKVYVHAFVIFSLFNIITTWWIYHATLSGALMAFFFSAVLVAFPFWLFHLTRKHIGNKEGYIAFVLNILAFEWLDYNWALSHPWLPFGNVFASSPSMVQWFEFTGVSGGSLWVVLVNLIVFFMVKKFRETNAISSIKKLSFLLLISISLPILISFQIGRNVELGEENETLEIVLTQPNVDPYQKFGGAELALQQTKQMMEISGEVITQNTSLIIAPETALSSSLEESMMIHSDEVKIIQKFLADFPKAKLLTGASTHAFFEKENSIASRELKQGGFWEAYNSALLIDTSFQIDTYHKMKLVLGVETLPFQFITKPLESLFDLGGTSGSLGTEKEPKNFTVGKTKVAPTICYESIYGEFIGEFCAKGAGIIAVSTNDAWWYDTPGYKQLLAYTQLRAIENRKWIARSANTGISCFINPKGEIVKKTKWEESTAISMKVPVMQQVTFYSQHGDFLSRIALFVSPLLILLTFVRRFKNSEV